MKVIAINGSPRKNWNTQTLLQNALEGAASAGAETAMVNLFDLDYTGCIGCLGCKRQGGDGHCVVKDQLSPVLHDCAECDAIILGSPIYLHETTGAMRSFIERLVFPYISYDEWQVSLFKGSIKTAFVFTTNCPEDKYDAVGYTQRFADYQDMLTRIFGQCRIVTAGETLQTNDYEKYHMAMFDIPERRRRREEIFPQDCKNAFALGQWAAEQ